jgi:hypothetical protein
MKTLQAHQIDLAYDGKPIIESLDLHIPLGMITALVGLRAASNIVSTLKDRLMPAFSVNTFLM